MSADDNLSVTVNGKDLGLAQLLRTLDALGKQVDQSLTQAGARIGQAIGGGAGRARPAVDQLGQATLRASRDALALAQTYARGQASAGDYEGAIRRLNSAMESQSVVNVRQAAQIQNQIAQYERAAQAARDKAAAEAQQSGTMGQLAGVAGQLGLALALPAAAAGAQQLARQGATADIVRQRFEQLAATSGTTGTALLAALRAASGGEINDLNLQLAANRAQLLGVADSAQEFATLMAIARDRAQQLGTDSATAFDDLVTGLGRGSPEILDNLGIMVRLDEANAAYAASIGKTVDALTAAERKQALINAVLKDGEASIAATGGAAESTAGSIAKFDAAVANLSNKLGSTLATGAAPSLDMLSSLANSFDLSRESILAFVDAQSAAYAPTMTRTAELNRSAAESLLDFLGVQSAVPPAVDAAAAAQAANEATAQALARAYQDGTLTLEQYDAAMAQLAAAQGAAASASDGATAAVDAQTQAIGAQLVAAQQAEDQARQLAEANALVGNLGAQVAGGLLTIADAAAVLAEQYGIAADAARDLIAAQAQKATQERFANQRMAREELLAGGGRGGQLSDSAAAFVAEQEAAAEQAQENRRRASGGRRVAGARSTNDQLLKAQQEYVQKSLDAEEQYQEDLARIAEDGAKKREAAQNAYNLSGLRGRQGFYAGLANIEDQALARELSSRYEQAAAEAQKIAQEQGADAAQAYLEASQRAIEAQGQIQQQIADAEAEGDANKAEYYRGLLALQQAADAEELRQIQAQGSAIAQAENAQYAEAEQRYVEHLERMGQAYDRKFGNAPPGLAPPPPASAGTGSTGGTAAAGTTDGTATGAATGAGSATLVAAPDVVSAVDAGLGRVEAAVRGLGEGLAAVERRVGAVESAVRGLRSSGVVGG